MRIVPCNLNETIDLGNGITVTVVEIRDDKVRLQVQVPKGVPVHRAEVYEALFGKPPPGGPAPQEEE
jgi:carbon storage regulator